MQARGEQDWVQERQLIPIGGDDETEDETTSVSPQTHYSYWQNVCPYMTNIGMAD